MSLLPQFAGFAITLAALIALSRWVSQQVQLVTWRLTGDERIAVVVYYLLLFPGIVLHELSHALMATLLGLKVGKFSLGPRAKGRYVQLGAVTIASGGAVRDSLIGLAPFLSGTAFLLLISYQIFNVGALGQAWLNGGWAGVLGVLPDIWHVADFWLWAYLIFAISNTMTPSPADRQPWLIGGLYVVLMLVAAYLLGALSLAAEALAPAVAGALPALTLAFLFTLGLDLLAAAMLLLFDFLVVIAKK